MRLKKTVMILDAVVLASLAQGSTGKLFLCFDDRNFNGWESSIPLFTKYKAHATFFISGSIDDRAITCMRRLKDAGHSLGLHGLKHRRAPEALRELGAERYLSEEVLPQIAAARNAGFNIRNWAYPYSTRTAATDTALMRHFGRARTGHLFDRDPITHPLVKVDQAFYPADNPFIDGFAVRSMGIGERNETTIDELRVAFKRMHDRRESLFGYAHNITSNPKRGDISLSFIEEILKVAKEEGIAVVGYDEVPEHMIPAIPEFDLPGHPVTFRQTFRLLKMDDPRAKKFPQSEVEGLEYSSESDADRERRNLK